MHTYERRWTDDPWPLHRSRTEGLADGGCPDRWLIVDSRPRGICDPGECTPSALAANG